MKSQRSNNNYPPLEPPTNAFESSNSSNHFHGLPLTPGIVNEDINSPNTPQTPHLNKQGMFYFISVLHGTLSYLDTTQQI